MILKPGIVTAIECLHYALNLPTSVVITGIHSLNAADQPLQALRTFHPMGKEEVASLLARTAETAKDGKFEMYKTSTMYDATARDPSLMGRIRSRCEIGSANPASSYTIFPLLP